MKRTTGSAEEQKEAVTEGTPGASDHFDYDS